MSMDTVTVKEIKAATARLNEIIELHAPREFGFFPGTRRMVFVCDACAGQETPCPTVKLARRALKGLTGGTP